MIVAFLLSNFHLPIYLLTHLPIYLFTYLPIYLLTYLPFTSRTTACPPNSFLSAAMILPEKVSSCKER